MLAEINFLDGTCDTLLFFLLFFFGIEVLVLACSFFRFKNKYWPVFAILSVFVGFRNYGGVDDINFARAPGGGYIGSFYLYKSVGDHIFSYSSWESSYFLLCKLALSLHMSYKAVFLIYAVLTYIFLYLAFRFLCKTRLEWLLAVGSYQCFYLITGLSLMRQSLAMAMIFYAVTLMMRSKTKKAVLVWALSILIHTGAVFAVIIFFLFSPRIRIRISKWIKVAMPPVCFLVGISGLLNTIIRQFSWILPQKYHIYFVENHAGPLSIAQSAGLLSMVFLAVYLLQFLLDSIAERKGLAAPRSKYFKQASAQAAVSPAGGYIEILERGETLYLCLYFIALASGVASRVSVLFLVFMVFLLNTFLARFPKAGDKKALGVMLLFCLFIFYFYQMATLPQNIKEMIFPYRWSVNLFQNFSR